MIKIFTGFLGLCSSLLFAQLPINDLIGKTWILTHMESPFLNHYYNYLVNPEYANITLNFYLDNGVLKYSTKVCSTKSGDVSEIVTSGFNKIEFVNNIVTGQSCVDPITHNFEDIYFEHIFNEDYFLNIIPLSIGIDKLTLSSNTFCSAQFISSELSTDESIKSNFNVYPNPVKDRLVIENPNSQKIKIKIINSVGKLVVNTREISSSTELDVRSLPKGLYFISIETYGAEIQTKKLIKE